MKEEDRQEVRNMIASATEIIKDVTIRECPKCKHITFVKHVILNNPYYIGTVYNIPLNSEMHNVYELCLICGCKFIEEYKHERIVKIIDQEV